MQTTINLFIIVLICLKFCLTFNAGMLEINKHRDDYIDQNYPFTVTGVDGN
jgi:hypothetical protein